MSIEVGFCNAKLSAELSDAVKNREEVGLIQLSGKNVRKLKNRKWRWISQCLSLPVVRSAQEVTPRDALEWWQLGEAVVLEGWNEHRQLAFGSVLPNYDDKYTEAYTQRDIFKQLKSAFFSLLKRGRVQRNSCFWESFPLIFPTSARAKVVASADLGDNISARQIMLKPSTHKVGGQLTDKRTGPVHATPDYVAGQDPEFLDARGVQARFSIRRSLLYDLMHRGCIRSVSLRKRGQCRGKRLFCVHSLREFLRQRLEGRNETS